MFKNNCKRFCSILIGFTTLISYTFAAEPSTMFTSNAEVLTRNDNGESREIIYEDYGSKKISMVTSDNHIATAFYDTLTNTVQITSQNILSGEVDKYEVNLTRTNEDNFPMPMALEGFYQSTHWDTDRYVHYTHYYELYCKGKHVMTSVDPPSNIVSSCKNFEYSIRSADERLSACNPINIVGSAVTDMIDFGRNPDDIIALLKILGGTAWGSGPVGVVTNLSLCAAHRANARNDFKGVFKHQYGFTPDI